MHHFTYSFGKDNCGQVDSINLSDGKLHTHSFDEIAIVISGTAIHKIGKEEFPLMRGDAFVIHGNQSHGYKKLNKFHVLNIIYKRDFFEQVKNELDDIANFNTLFVYEPCFRKHNKFKVKLHLNPHQLNNIMHYADLMKNELIKKMAGYTKMADYFFKAIVINLCRYYSEVDTPLSKSLVKVGRAIDFMEKKFAEDISLQKLADEAEMSMANFLRAFKKITNCTPIDFLIRLRIEKAMKMMEQNPNSRIIDISMKTGFWNSSYFSRKFKEITGTTPTNYLKKMRGRE